MGDSGALAALIAEQDGLITSAQALRVGLSRKEIRGRLDRREWCALVRGIYRSSSHPLTESLLVRAAVAAHHGVADRTTAAWWHGMLDSLAYPLTVATANTTTADRWSLGPLGLTRRHYDDADLTTVRGLRVTTPPATVVFGAAAMPDGGRFLDRALQRGVVTVTELEAVVERYAGSRGIGEARRLVRIASQDSESEAERLFVRLLREAGVTGWVQQLRFGRWRIDFGWPDLRVAIEIDGLAFHYQHDRFQADRAKYNALDAAGWRKKVYTWHDLTDRPGEVVDEVLEMLNARV